VASFDMEGHVPISLYLQLKHVREINQESFTPWSRVLPEKLKRPELLKKFPAFMEPEGS
jgi:hypothetical protein